MARTEPELTDAQLAALEPLLPPRRPATPLAGHSNLPPEAANQTILTAGL